VTNEELVAYLQGLGHTVEILVSPVAPDRFIVIRDFDVRAGSRAGQRHDVAIQWSTAVPYVAPSAIHVRPLAVAMGTASSQASPLGPDWQYLSRILRVPATPPAMLVHICTVLAEL
jgi:hypothetical protein